MVQVKAHRRTSRESRRRGPKPWKGDVSGGSAQAHNVRANVSTCRAGAGAGHGYGWQARLFEGEMHTIHDEERASHRPKLQEDVARRDGHFSVRRYEPHRSTATIRDT